MQAIIRQKAAQIAVIALKSTTYKQITQICILAEISDFLRFSLILAPNSSILPKYEPI